MTLILNSDSWTVLVRHSQARKLLILILRTPFHQIALKFLIFCINGFFPLVTYLLMPSDKHNSKDYTLISSLINVASSQDVPFHQLQQL